MSRRVNDRFESWIDPEVRRRVVLAADLVHESVGDFVREAAEQRANAILLQQGVVTVVPVELFDEVLSVLDEKARPHPALERAAERTRRRGPRTPTPSA